jgi:hypothetical protein
MTCTTSMKKFITCKIIVLISTGLDMTVCAPYHITFFFRFECIPIPITFSYLFFSFIYTIPPPYPRLGAYRSG